MATLPPPAAPDELLREAARARGRGLFREARARLARNRPARWSLRLLVVLALGALLAPLLPLPSPMALALSEEPGPPSLAEPWNRGWRHRVTLTFRFDEPMQSRELFLRAESALLGLVTLATRVQPEATPIREQGRVTALELALPYRPEFDPHLGSQLEDELAQHLAGRMEQGRLRLKNGGAVAVSFLGASAENGYWELNALDRRLLDLRQRLFGFHQTGALLGTDAQGRDLLSRLVWGSRVSLSVALAAALVSLVIGVSVGAVAGYVGGWVDALLMRVVDVLYSIPFLFVVIFVITLLHGYRAELEAHGIGHLTAFYAVLGLFTWLTMARVVRGQVLALRHQEFVAAARLVGASHARILWTHVLPNVLGIVLVYLTLTIPSVMLLESFLSFLGLGVEPPRVSWGLLAADAIEAINPLRSFWWLVVWPAVAMGGTLLALNVLGDGLRDALDPKLARR